MYIPPIAIPWSMLEVNALIARPTDCGKVKRGYVINHGKKLSVYFLCAVMHVAEEILRCCGLYTHINGFKQEPNVVDHMVHNRMRKVTSSHFYFTVNHQYLADFPNMYLYKL